MNYSEEIDSLIYSPLTIKFKKEDFAALALAAADQAGLGRRGLGDIRQLFVDADILQEMNTEEQIRIEDPPDVDEHADEDCRP